jgi:hypothetical protein
MLVGLAGNHSMNKSKQKLLRIPRSYRSLLVATNMHIRAIKTLSIKSKGVDS